MAEPLHRTQVLLRKDQHEALAARAEREGLSISRLLRALVDEELTRKEAERHSRIDRRRAALERIRKHHTEVVERRGGKPIDVDPTDLIREIRDERDDELFSRLTASGD